MPVIVGTIIAATAKAARISTNGQLRTIVEALSPTARTLLLPRSPAVACSGSARVGASAGASAGRSFGGTGRNKPVSSAPDGGAGGPACSGGVDPVTRPSSCSFTPRDHRVVAILHTSHRERPSVRAQSAAERARFKSTQSPQIQSPPHAEG